MERRPLVALQSRRLVGAPHHLFAGARTPSSAYLLQRVGAPALRKNASRSLICSFVIAASRPSGISVRSRLLMSWMALSESVSARCRTGADRHPQKLPAGQNQSFFKHRSIRQVSWRIFTTPAKLRSVSRRFMATLGRLPQVDWRWFTTPGRLRHDGND